MLKSRFEWAIVIVIVVLLGGAWIIDSREDVVRPENFLLTEAPIVGGPMRYLHTMVRVRNIDESLDFYCNKMGMEEVRRVDHEGGRIIFNIFHQLADEGKIVVVVNHDLGESIANFDELILLNKELIAAGDRQKVLKDENLQRAYGGKVMFFSEDNN